MANVKISQLPEVSTLSSTDVLPSVATVTTSKITVKNLGNAIPGVTSSISASNALTASYVNGSIFTANNLVLSASYSVTASFAITALTSSFVTGALFTSDNPALSASYALTASYALNSNVASTFPFDGQAVISQSLQITGSFGVTGSVSISGSFVGFTVLQQVSESFNFADDTAAAAGGVPLGGIYRSGNFIVIRIV